MIGPCADVWPERMRASHVSREATLAERATSLVSITSNTVVSLIWREQMSSRTERLTER